MKPYAYSYSKAQHPCRKEPLDYSPEISFTAPSHADLCSGRARDVTALYSRAQVAEIRARASQEYKKQFDRANRAEALLSLAEAHVSKDAQAALETFGGYAQVLIPFVKMMAKELAANSHKGDRAGWLGLTPAQAWSEVKHHVKKLVTASSDEENREHAADVANCCMMLLDVMGLLVDTPVTIKPGCVYADEDGACGSCDWCLR